MAKIETSSKFVIRLTPEERTRFEGMTHCGIGDRLGFKSADIA